MLRIGASCFATCLAALASAHAMELTSSDVQDGAVVPEAQVYTRCGGQNESPALAWRGLPQGTKTIAVTVIDTSVPPSNWTHWIVLDLPANATSLGRGVSVLPAGATQVESNFGEARYDGPCPPAGSGEHRYVFTVWALKSKAPSIAPNEAATSVANKLQSVAIAKASLTARYGR